MITLPPQFFDIFGIGVFVYIIAMSLSALSGRQLPRWTYLVLLFIGVIGLTVDSLTVYNLY